SLLRPEDLDALRRREAGARGRECGAEGAVGMSIPFFAARDVEVAVKPARALHGVHAGFLAHARGEWAMQPKLYVTNYPAGDFRAMPALGGGEALLKWVTWFPRQAL